MIYKDLILPKIEGRPFFYTSFAATIDGKVQVKRDGYWPIGGKADYEFFTFLRAQADCIIDGKNTALKFGKNTIDTIHSDNFQKLRKKLHKKDMMTYIVMSRHQDKRLESSLKNSYNFQPILFREDLQGLVRFLQRRKLEKVFIDGGPRLIGSLLAQDLLDEIFLTIAPKIFGSSSETLTMVEGRLFSPSDIKRFALLSVDKVGNEVCLRYRVINQA